MFKEKGCCMTAEWKIIAGPSKFDLMSALFDKKAVSFMASCRTRLWVRVMAVKALDDGHDAWEINGFLSDSTGSCPDRRKCMILFSNRNQEGTMCEIPPENPKRKPEYFDGLQDNELRRHIASNQKTALRFKESFENYLMGLESHDRLVAEAIASQKMMEMMMHSELDHSFYVYMRNTEVSVAHRH
jgi:hypothetical protein